MDLWESNSSSNLKWEHYLDYYRSQRNFQACSWIDKKISVLNDYLNEHQLSAAVLSVSGGVDSAVTLGLLKRAMSVDNSPLKKIWAIAQPIHSSDWALERAKELCNKMDIDLIIVDQTNSHDLLSTDICNSTKINANKFSNGQLRSYMRTPVNYYMAQLSSQEGFPSVVIGTGNLDEDGYLAYFCKAGDGVVDIQLISDLHKSEVFSLARYLNIPPSIIDSPPSADLWDDQEDEEELGFTYDFVEFYTGFFNHLSDDNGITTILNYLNHTLQRLISLVEPMPFKYLLSKEDLINSLNKESLSEFTSFRHACEKIHKRNKHKLNGVVNL